MDLNNRTSLDIMGFSLCLDDAGAPTNPNSLLPSNINSNEVFIKPKLSSFNNGNNLNSFYIANEEDAVESIDDDFLFSSTGGKKINHSSNKTNNDTIKSDSNTNILFEDDFKKLYVSSANVPINRNNLNNQNGHILNQMQNSSSNSNLTELDNVKHKLSSFWNNVKYGWTRYLKMPNKLNTDSNEPVYILGKKFYMNDEMITCDLDQISNSSNFKQIGSSSFYDYFDASIVSNNNYNNPNNLSESYIAPSSFTNTNDFIYADMNNTNQATVSTQPILNNDDYSTMNFSFLSTSPNQQQILTKLNHINSQQKQQQLNKRQKSPVDGSSNSKISKLINENMKTPLEQELYSRLWFTYRKDFEPLNGNIKYTSDCGWGCMLRSVQMLLAQGLLLHFFGTNWSLYKSLQTNKDCNLYKDIISLFNDRSNKTDCPFGLHHLLEIADRKLSNEDKTINNDNNNNNNESQSLATRVGTWFGPTSVCLLVKDALNDTYKENKLLENIRIYVAQDCTIFKKDVIELCKNDAECTFIPCIILVSVRLGGEELNDIYIESLKMFLQMEICIGMIGGKPRHSLYFIGYQGDKVVYLDPHTCQSTVNVFKSSSNTSNIKKIADTSISSSISSSKGSYDDGSTNTVNLSSSITSNSSDSYFDYFDNTSYHCSNPSTISFTKLDPSLAVGFYCKTLTDLEDLCDLIKKTSTSDTLYPILGVCDDTFEQAQLNYQSFSIDDKMNASTLIDLADQKTNIQHNNDDTKINQNSDSIFPIENSTNQLKPSNNNKAYTNRVNLTNVKTYLSNKINSKLSNNNNSKNRDLRMSKTSSSTSRKKSSSSSSKHKDQDDFVLV